MFILATITVCIGFAQGELKFHNLTIFLIITHWKGNKFENFIPLSAIKTMDMSKLIKD